MIGTLISLIIYLIIVGILWWAGNAVLQILSPYIGEPFMSIIRVILIVILALILISVLLQLVGAGTGLGLPHIPTLR